ncbi:hypothetical protein DBV15_12625 [Temnothorax longispinosus]|uniref:Uncharacterized protein n=1 Tax=Temnothorax longispinosus TaxID=300112 RepID=A0A4S2KNH1_9HYME|nr:hypothetical protein DBV15_12625 [Temnothorax longispinosus]
MHPFYSTFHFASNNLAHDSYQLLRQFQCFETSNVSYDCTHANETRITTSRSLESIPVHTKRLILFILRRSSKAFALNVGQIFVAPLECFATKKFPTN